MRSEEVRYTMIFRNRGALAVCEDSSLRFSCWVKPGGLILRLVLGQREVLALRLHRIGSALSPHSHLKIGLLLLSKIVSSIVACSYSTMWAGRVGLWV